MLKQNGVSLIELLLSLSLSTVLMAMLFQYYLNSKQQYKQVESRLEHFLELQLIGQLMVDSVARAGFTPCGSFEQLMLVDKRFNAKRELIKAIFIDPKTAAITVKYMHESFMSGVLKDSNTLILSKKYSNLQKKPIIIADCFSAEIHNTLAGSDNTIKLVEGIDAPFSKMVYVGEWIEETFSLLTKPSPVFFYTTDRKERLSTSINYFSVVQSERTVQITLGHDKEPQLNIMTGAYNQ